VLTLPVGWEPCWTYSETPGGAQAAASVPSSTDSQAQLAEELHTKGWIIYSARTDQGDWDMFVMRPDGSDRRKYIGSPEFNEGGARVSPDGKRVLYYRQPKAEEIENNQYGVNELVIANVDGSNPVVYGNQFPWATWGPDSRQVSCLTPRGIKIFDLESRKVVRELPRKGVVSQLGWSPDGKWLIGTADHLGQFWNIGLINAVTGDIIAVSETDRYNCTSDWVPDSKRIVYARGIIPEKPGRAELWVGTIDGRPPQPLYAEEGHHIYDACSSPDMKYLIFTRSVGDLTRVDQKDTSMAIIRWDDTPMRGDDGESLRQRLPDAKRGPRFDLGPGWEPFWTLVDLAPAGGASTANK
jgi:Tol biopolymer transport system component